MCVSPIRIRNKASLVGAQYYCRRNPALGLQDVTSQYMYVPCGHCSECISMKQNYLIQRFRMQYLFSDFFFCTLTLDDKHLKFVEVPLDTGEVFRHAYAPKEYIQKLMKRLRRHSAFDGMPFKYFCVSEYGGKNHRPHYHVLFMTPKSDKSIVQKRSDALRYADQVKREWCVNIGCTRAPIYEPLFTYHEKFRNGKLHKNFDFHFVEPLETSPDSDDVSFYVSKYVLKVDPYVVKRLALLDLSCVPEFRSSARALFRPYCLVSKGLGLLDFRSSSIDPVTINSKVAHHISTSIMTSLEDARLGRLKHYAPYLYTQKGVFILSPFYKHYFLKLEDALEFQSLARKADRYVYDDDTVRHFVNDYDAMMTTPVISEERLAKDKKNLKKLRDCIGSYNPVQNDERTYDEYFDESMLRYETEDYEVFAEFADAFPV